MFVLNFFQPTLKSLKIISFELRHPYNTLKVPQISKIRHGEKTKTITNIQNSTLNSSFDALSKWHDLDIRYLDLSNCNIDILVLQKLLYSCHLLEKLSLYEQEVTSKLISRICLQNGQSLKVLVLSQCKGLDLESVQHIVKNCVELTEINFDCTYLPKDAIDFLANSPMTKVTRK
jgi:hypothetical protein